MRRLLPLVATLAIAAVTLRPVPGAAGGGWTSCLTCDPRALADLLANLVLFAPLGVALAVNGLGAGRVLACAATLSALIEAAQFSFVPGRDTNPMDVVYNAAGAWIAALVFVHGRRWIEPAPGRSGWRSAGAVALLALVVATEGLLLQPSVPRSARVEWTDASGTLALYGGAVQSATAGGAPLRPGRAVPAGVAGALARREVRLSMDAIAGPPPDRLAQILSVRDGDSREIFLLGARGEDLVIRYRTRAAGARLDQPGLVVPGALRDARAGERVRIDLWGEGEDDAYCVAVNGKERCDVGFSAGSGWKLLLFTEGMPVRLRIALDLLWIAAWLVPVGYYSRRRLSGGLSTAAAAVALLALPGLVGLLPLSGGEAAAALGGWLVGFALRARSASWGSEEDALVDRDVRAPERGQRSAGGEELGVRELCGKDGD